jgi:hypothetical protein
MRKIIWSVFLLTTSFFTSCSLDDDQRNVSEGNNKLIVNFSIQDPTSGLATRASIAPEAGEENIKTLDLIFFTSGSDASGSFKGWKELTGTSSAPLVMNTDMAFDFSDIGLQMTDAYDILVVANMGDNYLPADGSQTLEEYNQKQHF